MRNSPAPLRHVHVDDPDYVPAPRRYDGSRIVETTWQRIAAKAMQPDRKRNEYFNPMTAERDVANMRAAFAAGVFAASAALNLEDASSYELSVSAERVADQ